MLTNKDLAGNPEWYFSSGTFGYDWYRVGDMHNSRTGEQGIGVKIDFTEVGKDELDALYRIQRIIEDKIHEVRMRPVQVENGNLPDVKALFPGEDDEQHVYMVEVPDKERQFHIFHATGPCRFTPVEEQPRIYAGWINATSLENAFKLAQNDNHSWSFDDTRSTCVGDVIQDNDDFYMVTGSGFKLLQSMEDLKNECALNGLENQTAEC